MVESQRDSKSYLKIDDGVKNICPFWKRRGPKHLRTIVLAHIMRDFESGGLCVIDFFSIGRTLLVCFMVHYNEKCSESGEKLVQ